MQSWKVASTEWQCNAPTWCQPMAPCFNSSDPAQLTIALLPAMISNLPTEACR